MTKTDYVVVWESIGFLWGIVYQSLHLSSIKGKNLLRSKRMCVILFDAFNGCFLAKK